MRYGLTMLLFFSLTFAVLYNAEMEKQARIQKTFTPSDEHKRLVIKKNF